MRDVLERPQHYQKGTSAGLERYTRQAYLRNYRDIVRKLTAGR